METMDEFLVLELAMIQKVLPYILVFGSIYTFSLLFGGKMWGHFTKLDAMDKTYFASMMTAYAHSFYVGYYGILAVYYGEVWTQRDFNYVDSYTSHVVEVFLGYMLWDMLVVLYFNVSWGGWGQFLPFVAHHTAALLAYRMMVRDGNGHPLGIMGAITELTSPCLHTKWLMEKSGHKNTPPYILNGTIFTVSFFFIRIVIGTWCSFTYVYGLDAQLALLGSSYYMFYTTYGVALALQYYWFYKIAKGFARAIASAIAPADKSSSKAEGKKVK